MSQITKPIALDETLQDVVTAIQGITQGGMIVSTGNVGSATQPVYINGGVPTAGKDFAITTGTPTVNATYVTSVTARWLKSGNVVELRIQGLTTTTGIPWKTLLSGLPKPVQGIGINNVFFETPVSHDGASVGVAAGRITDQGALMITETPSALSNVDINLLYMTND